MHIGFVASLHTRMVRAEDSRYSLFLTKMLRNIKTQSLPSMTSVISLDMVEVAVSEINVEPILWTVRFYPDGGGYPGPFVGVCTVQAVGPKTVFVSAMHGNVTKKHITQGAEYFYSMGFRFVLMSRHGEIVQRKIERYLNGTSNRFDVRNLSP
jgi:hypothetical protein